MYWHVNFYIFKIEESTPKAKVKASSDVYHMDFDMFNQDLWSTQIFTH